MDQSIFNDVASHQALLIGHESRLKELETTIIDLKKFYKSLVDEVADIQNTLGTLKNVSDEISNLKSYFDSFVKSINDVKEDIYKRVFFNDSKIVSLEGAIAIDRGVYEGIFGEYKQCILDQNRDGIRLNKKIDSQANEHLTALQNLEQSLKAWSESKILEMLPKDATPIFENLRTEVFKKIEMIQIDCINAVLKAGNISNQIPMIEKRIENILLILKKYEISQ